MRPHAAIDVQSPNISWQCYSNTEAQFLLGKSGLLVGDIFRSLLDPFRFPMIFCDTISMWTPVWWEWLIIPKCLGCSQGCLTESREGEQSYPIYFWSLVDVDSWAPNPRILLASDSRIGWYPWLITAASLASNILGYYHYILRSWISFIPWISWSHGSRWLMLIPLAALAALEAATQVGSGQLPPQRVLPAWAPGPRLVTEISSGFHGVSINGGTMGYQKMGVPQNGWFIIFYTGESMNILHPDGCRGDDLGNLPWGVPANFIVNHCATQRGNIRNFTGSVDSKRQSIGDFTETLMPTPWRVMSCYFCFPKSKDL